MPNKKKKSVSQQSLELVIASQKVVTHRLAQMASAGIQPSKKDQQEMIGMGVEKIEAFNESWLAMSSEIIKYQQNFAESVLGYWMNPWSMSHATVANHSHKSHRAAERVIQHGLAPIHRRAVANAKRLGNDGGK